MNLPRNKNNKFYLIDDEGNEVEFNHAIDAQEALFGVFGKDDQDEEFEPSFKLPSDFDMKIKPKKNTGGSKEELMERQLNKKRPGRPPKNKTPEPIVENTIINDEILENEKEEE